MIFVEEFKCVAYAAVTNGIGLLWTQVKEDVGNDITCWVRAHALVLLIIMVDVS
jgi:hypothetical protein